MSVLLALANGSILDVSAAAAPVYFDIKSSKFSIVAEYNNTVTLVMRNIREDLYDITIKLDMPTPLVVLGGNRWWFSSVRKGETITIQPVIFAPKSAAGTALSGTLEANYKELGQVFFSSETHAIGFSIYGYIKLVVYGLSVEPNLASPGTGVTVSGNILNTGNVAAMFTNVSILSVGPIVSKSESVSYLGQVDPNSPAPFSVSAEIDPAAKEGSYPVTLQVTYQDDRLNMQAYSTTGKIQVTSFTERTARAPGGRGAQAAQTGFRIQQWMYAVIAGIAILVAFIIYKRRKSRKAAQASKPSVEGLAIHQPSFIVSCKSRAKTEPFFLARLLSTLMADRTGRLLGRIL